MLIDAAARGARARSPPTSPRSSRRATRCAAAAPTSRSRLDGAARARAGDPVRSAAIRDARRRACARRRPPRRGAGPRPRRRRSRSPIPTASASAGPGPAPRYLLAGGKGAALAATTRSPPRPLLVAADLDGDPREAAIRLALPVAEVGPARAPRRPPPPRAASATGRAATVPCVARERLMLGALALEDRPWPAPRPRLSRPRSSTASATSGSTRCPGRPPPAASPPASPGCGRTAPPTCPTSRRPGSSPASTPGSAPGSPA